MTPSAPDAGGDAPYLTVVVTIVDGGDALRRFLNAVLAQVDAPSMEIVVPFDSSVCEVAELLRDYPAVRPLSLGVLATERPITTAAGQHELYDRRRAAGLGAARGTALRALLEDRAPPRVDWARTMRRLHQELPDAAVGGAIECGSPDLLNWAFHACDFGRYGLPFESGRRDWVSDVNVCYKREAIESVHHVWADRFHEPEVHWALQARGGTLYLSNAPVVDYRTQYRSLGVLLPERFHWGRLFGRVRARHVGRIAGVALAALGPIILLRLFARLGLIQARRGCLGRFVRASPTILALLSAWTLGEAWGYITTR